MPVDMANFTHNGKNYCSIFPWFKINKKDINYQKKICLPE